MINDNDQLPIIKLFGNPEENFYSLGKKDRDGYILIQEQITKLCMRSEYTAKLIKKVTEATAIYTKKGSIKLESELKAYAEGLEKPYSDVLFTLLLPEIVAAFNKWMPNLLSVVPGCSSLLVWDKNNKAPVHGRVLDYAISGPYEEYERAVHYNFSNRLKSFSYATVGMPFPSLSSANEKGLTLALHYKHGDYFDITGQSIFSLMYQLSSYCTTTSEVKKYLSQNPSMAHWGIICSDKTGSVANFDIKGAQVYTEKYDLKDNKFLYFNNRPLVSSKESETLQPYGNQAQCLMRKDFIFDKMKKFDYQSKDIPLEVLKALTQINPTKRKSAKNWKMSTITPSSIQALTFNTADSSSYYLKGHAPKIFKGSFHKLSSIHEEIEQKVIKDKKHKETNYNKGIECIANAQSAMDIGNIEKAYHLLQLSIVHLEGYAEYYIAKFFFSVWQYMHEDSKKDLSYIYNDFEKLDKKLPPYLEEHRILFLMRLEKILGYEQDQTHLKQIKNQNIQKIYEKEVKLKPVAIKFLRKFIIPRIEILDIVYIYA